MADIIYRNIGLGLFEVELVSEAVQAWVKDKLGTDEIATLALVPDFAIEDMLSDAFENDFECEEEYSQHWADLPIQY